MSASDHANVLPARGARTWEVELLISGVAVFAMLQLPGWLDERMLVLEPRVDNDWRILLILAYLYAKSAAVTLAVTFVLHLLLRAVWIALVGLHGVYPDGVRLEGLKMGPIQAGVEQARLRSIPDAIRRADHRASVVFAIGVMIAVMFAGICVAFPGLLLAVNLAGAFGGWRVDPLWVMCFAAVVLLLPLVLALVADRRCGDRLPPDGLAHRAIHRVFRLSGRLGMGPGHNLMMSVLTTNDGPRRMSAMIFGLMMLVIAGTGASFVGMYKPELFGTYGLFPDSRTTGVEAAHYDDQRDPLRDGVLPYVQSRVVRGPYLQLTVPYDPRRVDAAMHACKTPGKRAPEPHAAALLGCLQALHPVTVDGAPLRGLRYEIASDARSDRPALLAMIDVRELPNGRHELQVARPAHPNRKPRPGEPDPGVYRIPFWR